MSLECIVRDALERWGGSRLSGVSEAFPDMLYPKFHGRATADYPRIAALLQNPSGEAREEGGE